MSSFLPNRLSARFSDRWFGKSRISSSRSSKGGTTSPHEVTAPSSIAKRGIYPLLRSSSSSCVMVLETRRAGPGTRLCAAGSCVSLPWCASLQSSSCHRQPFCSVVLVSRAYSQPVHQSRVDPRLFLSHPAWQLSIEESTIAHVTFITLELSEGHKQYISFMQACAD